MMGIFDFLNSDDPNQMAKNAMMFGLLSGKGNFGQQLGGAGMNAMQVAQEAKQAKQAALLRQMQLDEAQQMASKRKQQQEAEDRFRSMLVSPTMQASQAALSAGGGPTMANAAKIAPVDPQADLMFNAMREGLLSPLDYVKLQQKEEAPVVVGEGGALVRGGKAIYENKKTPKDDSFVALMRTAGIDPASPQGQALMLQRLSKEATHQPPVSLNNYGTPLPIKLPDGTEGYLQPPTRPGGPSQILKIPETGKPAVKPPSGGATQTQDARQSAGALARLENAMRILNEVEKTNPRSLEPHLIPELTRSVTEIGANYMVPAERQKVESAQLDALDAALWLATGAAYNKEQLNALRKAYFPQVGDKEGVRQEKKKNLQVVIDTARIRAHQTGGAIKKPDDIPQAEWDAMTPEDKALWK